MLDLSSKLVVGIDVHKRNHTAVLVNQYCQKLETYQFSNTKDDITIFMRKIKDQSKSLGMETVFAMEDTNGNGATLSEFIDQKGYDIYFVPAMLTKRERKRSTHCDKDDELDAHRVAKVMLFDSDRLHRYIRTDKTRFAEQVGTLLDDRRYLINSITGIKNQLHVILHKIFGNNYETRVTKKDIFCKFALKQWKSQLKVMKIYRSKRALVKMNMITMLREEVSLIEERLEKLAKKSEDIKLLKTIPLCGTLTASTIASEIKDIKRFESADALAKYAGIAPRIFKSSSKGKHFSDRRGNRKLNCAIYQLSLSLISRMGISISKEYYFKKRRQGKTGKQALKCLSKQMVKVIYAVLSNRKPYYEPT